MADDYGTCPLDVFEDERLIGAPVSLLSGHVLIMVICDDHGRFEGNPEVASRKVGCDAHELKALFHELETRGLVEFYEALGRAGVRRRVGQIVDYHAYRGHPKRVAQPSQRKASHYPAPDGTFVPGRRERALGRPSRSDPASLTEDRAMSPQGLVTSMTTPGREPQRALEVQAACNERADEVQSACSECADEVRIPCSERADEVQVVRGDSAGDVKRSIAEHSGAQLSASLPRIGAPRSAPIRQPAVDPTAVAPLEALATSRDRPSNRRPRPLTREQEQRRVHDAREQLAAAEQRNEAEKLKETS